MFGEKNMGMGVNVPKSSEPENKREGVMSENTKNFIDLMQPKQDKLLSPEEQKELQIRTNLSILKKNKEWRVRSLQERDARLAQLETELGSDEGKEIQRNHINATYEKQLAM